MDVNVKYACILYANGFTHLDQVQSYYEQSWLLKEYCDFTFKMGKTALSSLLDDLGRRTKRVIDYENALLNSASTVAIDGHAIQSMYMYSEISMKMKSAALTTREALTLA